MFSWLRKDARRKREPVIFNSVNEGLWKCYNEKLKPLESTYRFSDFHYPPMSAPDFEAKPMILLIGQYSVGKTSFIRYLLEKDFPGMRVGPEPTTDRFVAVMHGDDDQVIPGNAVAADPNKQFQTLQKFGNAFLQRFECSTTASPVLEGITIIDTPGVLSGEKQRTARGYDFEGIIEWFAQRSAMIILLFDAHKLDISDEFHRCIKALKGNEEKVRIVLNKADMVTPQQLLRVYGAQMWSLGKVLSTPEVARVYVGSFWDRPLEIDDMRKLFEAEEQDLFQDIQQLQRRDATRKMNDLIRRARLAKVHCLVISKLRNEMPSFFGKKSKKDALIKDLRKVYDQVRREANVSAGDFPPLNRFQEQLTEFDFSTFAKLNPRLIERANDMMATDIAHIMKMIPTEDDYSQLVTGGALGGAEKESNDPFSGDDLFSLRVGHNSEDWIITQHKAGYDQQFHDLEPRDGKLSGLKVKEIMVKSKLPNSVLKKIWALSDVDKDGMLDEDEFALAMFLISAKKEGHDLPDQLPFHLIPPSKRGLDDIDADAAADAYADGNED
jgi:GTPase SAR1 family protein